MAPELHSKEWGPGLNGRKFLLVLLLILVAGCGGLRPLEFSAQQNGDEQNEGEEQTPPTPAPRARVPLGTFTVDATTTTLSQTGLFRDLPNLLPAEGVIEYDVNVALFSDDASKRRFMAVPSNAQITYSANASWTFPTGTILIKHFDLQDSATTKRKLETRLMVRGAAAWTFYLFIWNAAQTDATISTATTTAPATYFDAGTGLSASRTWTFPAQQCNRCHIANSGFVLGVNTLQINRGFGAAVGAENQLVKLNRENFFNSDISLLGAQASYPKLDDVAQPLELRAKAYLGVNCSHCHQPGGPNAFIDFRFITPLANMNIVNVTGNAGIPRLVPSSKENSLMWNRILTAVPGGGTGRMPPVGRSVTHDLAVGLIGSWIDSL
ncbi:MAG: hypothetical protein ABL958_06790 [Bdellovibrionia bacterium]